MVKMIYLEGTSQEVLQTAAGLGLAATLVESDVKAQASADAAPDAGVNVEDEDKWTPVSVEVARLMLKRRPLSPEQRAILVTIAKRDPNWVPAADLMAATGYTGGQFAGAMGALGRRFTHTDGYTEDTFFFDQEWDYEARANRYRLPDSVLEAMKMEKLI